jgi:triacylglycerol lipase
VWLGAIALYGLACGTDSIPAPVPPAAPPPAPDVTVASISLTPANATLYAGKTLQISATLKNSQGVVITGKTPSWSSNAGSVASVADGIVSANAFGSAIITAAADGVSSTATVNVLHDPIVFVHGFGASAAVWTTMVDRFKADGWTDAPLVTWTYDSNQPNATTAQQLATKIDSLLAATGAKRVDIIAHSMGGLSSRYYTKNLGGADNVDAFVALGTPNHGTTVANICPIPSCVEMRPGSTFLSTLNAGDETPGSPRYATWWTPCDQVTTPPESVILTGAQNTQTACITHTDLHNDAVVYAQVRDWVR